jgi:membrane-associated phospholipid phosphatase
MEEQRAGRVDGLIWLTIAAIAAFDVSVGLTGWFRIDWASVITPCSTCAVLAAGAMFYTRIRRDARLAASLRGTAQIVAFAAVAAPLSYIVASAALPLRDPLLMQWDQAVGLDWPALWNALAQQKWLLVVLSVAYASFLPQTVCVVLALGFSHQIARLQAFVAAFVLTSLITIAISALLPAEGPWLFLGLDSSVAANELPISHTSWPVFMGLRDGSFRTLTALGSEGIITFPSLHAALGLVFACALWSVRRLRLIALALNALMIAATPFEGSHYFADVAAGTAIAATCWFGCRQLLGRTPVRRSTAFAAAHTRSQDGVAASASPPLVPVAENAASTRIAAIAESET